MFTGRRKNKDLNGMHLVITKGTTIRVIMVLVEVKQICTRKRPMIIFNRGCEATLITVRRMDGTPILRKRIHSREMLTPLVIKISRNHADAEKKQFKTSDQSGIAMEQTRSTLTTQLPIRGIIATTLYLGRPADQEWNSMRHHQLNRTDR
jgi:hypothetical protein